MGKASSSSRSLAQAVSAAALAVCAFGPSSAHGDDVPNLWLAAGAHGAPCGFTGRCAGTLACDPTSLTCLRPADLRTEVLDIYGCRDDTELWVRVSNYGEIAVERSVSIPFSSSGLHWVGACNYNDPTAHCTFPGPPYPPQTPFFYGGSVGTSVSLAGGEVEDFSLPVNFGFPPFLWSVDSAQAGGYPELPVVGDILGRFPSPTDVCFF